MMGDKHISMLDEVYTCQLFLQRWSYLGFEDMMLEDGFTNAITLNVII
jgi:hypothetical protein